MTRRTKFASDTIGLWRRFTADEGGTTAMEYALMATLISLAIIGAVKTMGTAISTVLFGSVASALASMSK
jgi:pilus assembly protein Flp/PilA